MQQDNCQNYVKSQNVIVPPKRVWLYSRFLYLRTYIYIYFFTFHPFFFRAKSVYQHAFLSIPLFFHPWAHNGFRDYRARKLFSGFCLFLLRFKGWKINLPVELLPPATAAFVLPYVILSFFCFAFRKTTPSRWSQNESEDVGELPLWISQIPECKGHRLNVLFIRGECLFFRERTKNISLYYDNMRKMYFNALSFWSVLV